MTFVRKTRAFYVDEADTWYEQSKIINFESLLTTCETTRKVKVARVESKNCSSLKPTP